MDILEPIMPEIYYYDDENGEYEIEAYSQAEADIKHDILVSQAKNIETL